MDIFINIIKDPHFISSVLTILFGIAASYAAYLYKRGVAWKLNTSEKIERYKSLLEKALVKLETQFDERKDSSRVYREITDAKFIELSERVSNTETSVSKLELEIKTELAAIKQILIDLKNK